MLIVLVREGFRMCAMPNLLLERPRLYAASAIARRDDVERRWCLRHLHAAVWFGEAVSR